MTSEFSFKELYDVSLKATYPIEIGNRKIESGEVIAFFDKISIANLKDITSLRAARGGKGNPAHVFWETTSEIRMMFSQGVFSKTQLALLLNANLIETKPETIAITKREKLESNKDKILTLAENPSDKVYIYSVDTGVKINYTRNSAKEYVVDKAFGNYIVDYETLYDGRGVLYELGKQLLNGFVSLEGRTKIKEDITGQVKTGIVKIPKLKLVSNMSIRLGRDTVPMTSDIQAIAVPTGVNNNVIVELYLLEDDIESDI